MGGDVRANPKLSGTKHNVFGIQTGVAVSFLVRKRAAKGCTIHYALRPEFETADEKLSFLSSHGIPKIAFETVQPDKKGSWLNNPDNDFDALLPIGDKKTKQAAGKREQRAIFALYGLGMGLCGVRPILD